MTGDPSPGPSRTSTGARAGRGGGAAQSPSIAPLPSPGDRQPSGLQQQQHRGLPPIPEQQRGPNGSVNENGSPAAVGDGGDGAAHAGSTATPGRGVPRMGSLGVAGSQGVAWTPGSGRPQRHVERGDLPNTMPRPRVRPAGLPAPAPAPSGDMAPVEVDEGEVSENTFIWGTRVSAGAVNRDTKRFFTTFVDPKDPPHARPKYIQLVMQCVSNGDYVVNVDTADLRAVDVELYRRLLEYPREVLPLFDAVARQLAVLNCPEVDVHNPPYITVRVFNLEKKKTIRDLNPEDVDTLVSVQGMVTRTSPCIPELKAAHFKCQNSTCGASLDVLNMGGRVLQPEKCTACGQKFTLTLIHNMSSFSNKQLVRMQEKPNDIPEGETPHSVSMYVFDANVDVCRPGDRVTITGTYRAAPIRADPVRRVYHATFRTFIDVMHVQRDETARLFTVAAAKEQQQSQSQGNGGGGTLPGGVSGLSAPPSTSLVPSGSLTGGTQPDKFFGPEAEVHIAQLGAVTDAQLQARERRIQQLATDPQLYERLVASLAPNIYGLEDVKKGLLCQLFGGCGKTFPGGRVRGEINLLLVGDPSVSKSQLLSYMHALAPRGMYTSGKGSSATGLTASVSRDPETNELVLESGALVMSDRGICCIDEFDKMSESARAMLHETMEQQTVSVAKSGLISTLNARTSICACANPIGSRYNPSLTVSENINLPPTLLTRFDLIYLLLDKVNEASDMHLARHLISMYHEGATGATRPASAVEPIPQDELREYIAYARARINPRITSPAADELARVYASMRADGRQKRVVVATPRQLESLIRLSEAQARMRLSLTVEKPHVEEATRLWFHAMSMASPGEGGGIDQDSLIMGMTAARRRALQQLPQDLSRILSTSTGTTSVNELLENLAHLGVTREQLLTSLRQLKDMLVLDERSGVVRSRAALAKQQAAATAAGGAGGAAALVAAGGGAADMV